MAKKELIEAVGAYIDKYYVKENDDGWIDAVKSQREQLLLKLEERLQKAFSLHEDEFRSSSASPAR